VTKPAKFLTALYLKDLGRGRFELYRPFKFYSADLGLTLLVRSGFVTDLASVPAWVPGILVPKLGDWDYPAIIHDAAYAGVLLSLPPEYPYAPIPFAATKAQADDLFREGMAARGVNVFQRTGMYLAVKLFGKGQAWTGQ
jgi:hypothetical protein